MSAPLLRLTRIDTRQPHGHAALDALRERMSPRGDVVSAAGRQRTLDVFGAPLTPQQVVERICGEVRSEGLSAVLRYGEQLDRAELGPETIRVSPDELARAHRQADPEFLATIRRIRDRILEFQLAILHRNVQLQSHPGVLLQQRYLPLRRIGICVPGGAAAYPSTVLMTAVPAQAAGVDEIAVVAPPTPFGAYNPALLATCHELGLDEVYRLGGAQAVAAMAYGVAGLKAVDKIVGPGNLFVALAKKFVYGEVDIDAIAGPSELVVLADQGAPAEFIAADLLAQAEHAPGASVLMAWEDKVIEQVDEQLARQVQSLSRNEVTVQSLEDFGALIRVRDAEEACALTDWIAPEHLHIATANAAELATHIRNTGATFLGYYTPVALGDYAAGPSHVLPTGGTARWASGLSANDFLRAGSVIQFSEQALREIAADVRRMADQEGLTAHRASIDIRLPHV
jgi:histidinol dehydrogenase